MAGHAEQGEHRDVIDHMMGGGDSSPFNLRSLMKTALSGGAGDSGGGMGDRFDPVKAQASLDAGMQQNIYQSSFS
jgi:hypothetical protein